MADRSYRPRLAIKRVFDAPSPRDGKRVLVDRLWPRGLTKEKAHVDEWRRVLAPSDVLRKWFAHDPKRFLRFRALYRIELLRHPDELAELVVEAEKRPVTLLFAAKDSEHCNATVLKELLDENLY